MSDTPRTDALLAKWHGEWGADALLTLTRQLERELADEVRTARAMQCELDRINAARPEVRTPEGWKLVPVEATEKMQQAGNDTGCFEDDYPRDSRREAAWVWEAMLKAAPTMNSGERNG